MKLRDESSNLSQAITFFGKELIQFCHSPSRCKWEPGISSGYYNCRALTKNSSGAEMASLGSKIIIISLISHWESFWLICFPDIIFWFKERNKIIKQSLTLHWKQKNQENTTYLMYKYLQAKVTYIVHNHILKFNFHIIPTSLIILTLIHSQL